MLHKTCVDYMCPAWPGASSTHTHTFDFLCVEVHPRSASRGRFSFAIQVAKPPYQSTMPSAIRMRQTLPAVVIGR